MFFFNPFDDFEQNPYQQERKAQSLGSGVIIDKDKGYIVTNNHVIDNAEEIKVILYDDREFEAEIVATDPLSDIAVIKIDADNIKEAKLEDDIGAKKDYEQAIKIDPSNELVYFNLGLLYLLEVI